MNKTIGRFTILADSGPHHWTIMKISDGNPGGVCKEYQLTLCPEELNDLYYMIGRALRDIEEKSDEKTG